MRSMTVEQTARWFLQLGADAPLEQLKQEINDIPYERYCSEVQPKPGAAAFLRRLQQQGTHMCVVSSTDESSIRAAFDRLGFTGFFEFFLSPNVFGSGKDQPEIFYEAAKRLGGSVQETVVFEDALYAVRTAKEAGFPVVALADECAGAEEVRLRQLADLYLPDLRCFPWTSAAGLPSAACCALVLAAGASTRMGVSKQEIPLLGIPALVYVLRAFTQAKSVDRVVLVCPPGQQVHFQTLAVQWNCADKLAAVVPGGTTRQQSATAGAAAAGDCAYLAVHDGARTMITPAEIDRVVRDAVRRGAAALAVPVKDTIKVTGKDGFVTSTPPRDSLWAVQTPQVFPAQRYRELLAAAEGDFTDDCQLFEHAGLLVHLCQGSYTNLKLTTPEDVSAAEAILQEREQ